MSAIQNVQNFGVLSCSSAAPPPRPPPVAPHCFFSVATSTSNNSTPCVAFPSFGKKLRSQGLTRIVHPLPALLLVVPVMRGLKSSPDYPEFHHQKSNCDPNGTGRGGREGGDQQKGGDEASGFKERRRFRYGLAPGQAGGGVEGSRWNSHFEIRSTYGRGFGYSGGRFRGRDGRGREENRHRRPCGADRGPRSGPGAEEYRYWCSAGEELPNTGDKFVIVSYNILADKNASEHYRGLYYHIPWRLMDWERRKSRIVQELGLWSPDIMCLQEVDQFEDLRAEFEKRGYQGAYNRRTGGSEDGCAIFWRSNRFRLLQEENIQFDEHGLKNNVAQLCAFQSIAPDVFSDYSAADLMDAKPPGNVVIVGNIHVLFNPKRGDIKLGQVRVLLESAHALAGKWENAPVVIGGDFNSTPASSIYQYLATSELDISGLNRLNLSGQVEAEQANGWSSSGSFAASTASSNGASQSVESSYTQALSTVMDVDVAEPDPESRESKSSTRIISYVETSTSYDRCSASDATSGTEILHAKSSIVSRVPSDKSVRRWHWTPEEIVAATGTVDETVVRHKLNLRSAYTEIGGEGGCRDPQGEPLVTTYHKKFMGTVDYIWHTEGLDTVRVLDTLPVNVLQRCQGLPSRKWGSDHLALACELAFHPKS